MAGDARATQPPEFWSSFLPSILPSFPLGRADGRKDGRTERQLAEKKSFFFLFCGIGAPPPHALEARIPHCLYIRIPCSGGGVVLFHAWFGGGNAREVLDEMPVS